MTGHPNSTRGDPEWLAGWPVWRAKVRTMGSNSHVSCLPKLVGAAEVAAIIGCTRKHVYDLAQKGQIPHYRIGGLIRFNLQEIAEWLESFRIAA